VAVSCLEEAQRTLGALTLSDSDEDMDRNGRNENRDIVRQIQVIQNRIHELQGEIEAAQAAQPAPAPAPAPPPEVARPPIIRTHLPDKFEGRRDDFPQFMADVRSYCTLTNVPENLRVDYAYRCLGKLPKKVWLHKRKAWESTHVGEQITLDVFEQLLTTVYDSQDRATKARNRLDTVYQGGESLDKYIERFTTLIGEVEAYEVLAMGEKVHRFKKGLRIDLQDKCVIDPHTGEPYNDLEVLIAALTKYDAALGAGQRPPKSRRVGHQLAATGNPQGQRTMDQDWTFMQHPQQAPAPVPIPQVGALSHHNPQAYPRRDGLPPSHRQDSRSVTPRDRECFSCGLLGHEQWECPVKKYAQGRPLSRDDQAAVQICMELFRAEGRPFPGYGSRPARLPMPPGAWQGGRGQGNGRGGRGQGRGGNFRGGRRGGGRGN
jgi:uncharacterized membrane protein YgcG